MSASPEWAKDAEVDLSDVMNELLRVSNYAESERVSGLLNSIVSDVNDVIAEVQRA